MIKSTSISIEHGLNMTLIENMMEEKSDNESPEEKSKEVLVGTRQV